MKGKSVFSSRIILMLFFFSVFASANLRSAGASDKTLLTDSVRILELEEFIRLAVSKDTRFEEILIDELQLKYREDILLPPGDIVLGARADHQFLLIQDQDAPDVTFSLSKLFPKLGTEVAAEYSTAPAFVSRPEDFSREFDRTSSFSALLTQPIAENAFGYVTRLRDRIIGVENEVLTYQIVEAYEDYMAVLLTLYLDWYEAYENFRVAENSYRENLKLLANMEERKQNNIALPIDVNKIRLQVLSREETLMNSRVRYLNQRNLVATAIRDAGEKELVPVIPKLYDELRPDFAEDYGNFRETSRTFRILHLLETASDLEVKRNANELLPSINLRTGLTSDWSGTGVHKEESLYFAGVSLEWPIRDEVELAQYRTSRINRDRTRLTTENAYYRLHSDIKNLYEQIERERKLVEIAEERIRLSEAVFADESENYTYGKVTINDYIDAFNALDSNRFNRVFHVVLQKKLIVEAMRLLDRLVAKEAIDHNWSY